MSNEYPPQNGHAHKKLRLPPSAPNSTLANLLSSQRRSIAQSARHRVQIARPFADSAVIERAAERATCNYSLPPTTTERGSNKESPGGYGKVAAHAISSNRFTAATTTTTLESRRVTFRKSTPLESTSTHNTNKQDGGTRILGSSRFTPPPSRKRKSRWDPAPVGVAGGGVRVATEWRNTEKLLVHQSPRQNLSPPPRMSNSTIRQTKHSEEDGETAGNNKQQTLQFISAAAAEAAAKQSTLNASTMTTINQQTTIHKKNQLHSTIANNTTKKINYSDNNVVTTNNVKEMNSSKQQILSMDRPGIATIAKIPMKKLGNAKLGNAVQLLSKQFILETLNRCPGIVKKKAHRNSHHTDEDDRVHVKQSRLDSSSMNDVLYQSSRPTIKQNDSIHKSSNGSQIVISVLPTMMQKKKYYNPFRVKIGNVVAVRFRKLIDGGNNEILPVVKDGEDCFRLVDDHLLLEQHRDEQSDITTIDKQKNGLDDDDPNCGDKSTNNDMNHHHRNVGMKQNHKSYEVWSTPIPGQDDGLSLLGSWIRCMFSKSYMKKWQRMNNNIGSTNQPTAALGRTVEGNVISILDNDGCEESHSGITVCLLIDRNVLHSLPFLQVLSDAKLRPSGKIEAQIRGQDKVIVQITLASVYQQRTKSKHDDTRVVTQWMVRKRVFANPLGVKSIKEERRQSKQLSHSLYVGDGNDEQRQQEKNWIWIASHTLPSLDDMNEHSDFLRYNNVRDTISQLVGEVVRIDTAPSTTEGADTIATVTIKRLWTPEQIQGGRMSHHNPLELFDNFGASLYFQAPITEFIVVGKQVTRRCDDTNKSNFDDTQKDDDEYDTRSSFLVTHSYQARDNIFTPLYQDDNILEKSMSSNDDSSTVCHPTPTSRTTSTENTKQNQFRIGQALSGLVTFLQSVACVDFTLPTDVGTLSLRPSFLPLNGQTRSKCYMKKTKNEEIMKGQLDMNCVKSKKRCLPSTKAKSTMKKVKRMLLDVDLPNEERQQVTVIESHCHRTVSFHQLDKSSWGKSKKSFVRNRICEPYFRENCRPRSIGKSQELPTLTSGRAARANSRRMYKSLAALGDTLSKCAVDRLARRDREQHLRFDKSQIHGWGVYAETPISMGDMIIEYRGELIGNAVADKREKEYEKSKMDDYMFRIDTYTLCDATVRGNVARYINASCSPNCYTQIITAGENKRIVIYAKRDIRRGEELCYDYKFNLEEDQCKRIPCHCGAVNCRGFMN